MFWADIKFEQQFLDQRKNHVKMHHVAWVRPKTFCPHRRDQKQYQTVCQDHELDMSAVTLIHFL